MTQTTVNIADVRVNGGTQSRANIDRSVVSDYAEAIEAGVVFPPIVVFYDGAAHWLADGFHRYEAYSQARVYDVPADIRQGTQRDAILYSVGANASHGLRRTNDDKRRAVLTLLGDAEWSKWSDREIARQCGVSHDFASRNRRSLSSDDTGVRSYTTKHGTPATMQTAAIGRSERPAPSAIERPDAVDPVAQSEPPPPETEEDKHRRQIMRMTPEAMVDEILGLRADLDDAKAKIDALTTERDDFKAKWKEATTEDMGRALGNAQRRADTAAGRMAEYQANAKRLEFKLKKAEARVAELENMEVVPA